MPSRRDPKNARLARAAWAYSGLSQKAMAEKAGIQFGTLRGYLGRGDNAKTPDDDDVRRLIEASGLPVSLSGSKGSLIERVEELEDRVGRIYAVAFQRVSAALGEDPPVEGEGSGSGDTEGRPD